MRAALPARGTFPATLLTAVLAVLTSCGSPPSGSAPTENATPHVAGKSKEDIGKYIVQIAGCHECHTPGITEGRQLKDISESEWLTGNPLGFSGPWGTTYASNLRLKAMPYTEQIFVPAMRKRTDRPPMPWSALHAMTDQDLGAVFAYLKALGPSGNPMPDPVPPGVAPQGPFIVMSPPQLSGTGVQGK